MIDLRLYKAATDLLKDRVILVTGASDGIGKAVSLACAAHGAAVILQGRNVKRLEGVYDEIIAAGGKRPSIVPMDFEKAGPDDYANLSNAIENEFGRLDGLLHNAAILGERSPIDHQDPTKWLRSMHVNVNAPFILTQHCLPLLRHSQDASIIFTIGDVVAKPRAYWGAYLPSNWARQGFMRMLAEELDSTIRVNSVVPGPVQSNIRLQAFPAEDRSKLPLPAAIVEPYLFLLGPDSKGVHGHTFDAQLLTITHH
jgi:NAD(P)-dependent dehydrogenase (short-subunit alcohol dehydrogenase family)